MSFSSCVYILIICFFKLGTAGGKINSPAGRTGECLCWNWHLSSSYPRGRGWAVSGGRPGLEWNSLQLRDSAGLSLEKSTGFAFEPSHPGDRHQSGMIHCCHFTDRAQARQAALSGQNQVGIRSRMPCGLVMMRRAALLPNRSAFAGGSPARMPDRNPPLKLSPAPVISLISSCGMGSAT